MFLFTHEEWEAIFAVMMHLVKLGAFSFGGAMLFIYIVMKTKYRHTIIAFINGEL